MNKCLLLTGETLTTVTAATLPWTNYDKTRSYTPLKYHQYSCATPLGILSLRSASFPDVSEFRLANTICHEGLNFANEGWFVVYQEWYSPFCVSMCTVTPHELEGNWSGLWWNHCQYSVLLFLRPAFRQPTLSKWYDYCIGGLRIWD